MDKIAYSTPPSIFWVLGPIFPFAFSPFGRRGMKTTKLGLLFEICVFYFSFLLIKYPVRFKIKSQVSIIQGVCAMYNNLTMLIAFSGLF